MLCVVKYQEIENTIRTYGNKMLVAGATKQGAGNLKHMQGLIMRPEKVNFGALREGNTYSFTVQMLNTGLDPCRYKITQPPPTTGLSVQAKPGPVSLQFLIGSSIHERMWPWISNDKALRSLSPSSFFVYNRFSCRSFHECGARLSKLNVP